MHSFVHRVNTSVTLAGLLLATLCTLASFTDTFHHPSVNAHIEVLKVNRFRKQLSGNDEVLKMNRFWKQLSRNDEVSLTFNMSMDLQPLFTWNTKQVFLFVAAEYETTNNSVNQVSLWDYIVQKKEHAKYQRQISNKYSLIDQGSNLRGKKIDLVLHWYIMPKAGRMIEDKMVMSEFQLPESYT